MPRNPLGVYSRPPGTDAISNRTISSAAYNANVIDVETDLNLPRPISAGGTGASDAAGAITNLGGPFVKKSGDTMTGSLVIKPGSVVPPWGAQPNFTVANATGGYMELTDGTHSTMIGADVGGCFIGSYTADPFRVRVGNAVKFQIATTGIAEFTSTQVKISPNGANPTFGSSNLMVSNTAGAYLECSDGAVGHCTFMGADVGGGFVGTYSAHDFAIRTSNAVRMTVNSAGAISIPGVLSGPTHKVGAGPNFPTGLAPVQIGYTGGGVQYGLALQPQSDTTIAIYFLNASGTACGSISQTLNTTAYNTSSDARLKNDLKSFDAGRIVDDTTVYNFAWIQSAEQIAAGELPERAYGVVGQEAIEVYPAAVIYLEKEDWWGVDYSKYVPVLLQEVKALRARVAALEGTPVPLQQPR